jgi:hypothetical protein
MKLTFLGPSKFACTVFQSFLVNREYSQSIAFGVKMFQMFLEETVGGESQFTSVTLDPALQMLGLYVIHHVGGFLFIFLIKGLNPKNFKTLQITGTLIQPRDLN